jgi:hypothetical protein
LQWVDAVSGLSSSLWFGRIDFGFVWQRQGTGFEAPWCGGELGLWVGGAACELEAAAARTDEAMPTLDWWCCARRRGEQRLWHCLAAAATASVG